jgi:AcrR family transcriptional regulator
MPRQGLNRRKVLEAALRVVDDEGLEELTMRRLAQVLGVEAPSLYKHITAKDDILDGIAGLVYEEIDFGDASGSFAERVHSYADSCRRALLHHPNAVSIMATRPVSGKNAIALAETVIEQMHRLGFCTEVGRRILNVSYGFIVGHALAEVGSGPSRSSGERGEEARGYDCVVSEDVARTMAFDPVDHDAEFELGISLIIAGIEQKAKQLRADRIVSTGQLGPASATQSLPGQP